LNTFKTKQQAFAEAKHMYWSFCNGTSE